MLELGYESEDEHEKIVEMAMKSSASFVVYFGKEMADAAKKLCADKNCFIIDQTDDSAVESVCSVLSEHLSCGDLILLKGSRGMALERISSRLLEK